MPSQPNARVYTVEPGVPFLKCLAEAVLRHGFPGAEPGEIDPLALSRMTILLPTRRACRALVEILGDAGAGRAMLLPRIRPIGDVEEDELALAPETWTGGGDGAPDRLAPAIGSIERQLLLAREVLERMRDLDRLSAAQDGAGLVFTRRATPAQAAALAGELCRLLDAIDTEDADLGRLPSLAADAFAENWQITTAFLQVITAWLPEELERRGLMQPMARRNALLEAEATRLAATQPAGPVIAAGSTGSIPATANLLKTISRLPRGAIVLPGLDRALDDVSWEAISPHHVQHPQFGLRRLLDELGVGRADVGVLPGQPDRVSPRVRLLSEAMRPTATTGCWSDGVGALAGDSTEAIAGLNLVEAVDAGQEAAIIGAIMRKTLGERGRTVALVTPDRRIARRVAVTLRRWGIEVDDSAGEALSRTVPGVFMRLIAAAAASRFSPVDLLNLLKHPLLRLSRSKGEARAGARLLELAALRGVRPGPGFAGLRKAVAATSEDIRESRRLPRAIARLTAGDIDTVNRLIDDLEAAFAPLAPFLELAEPGPFGPMVEAHVAVAETLASEPDRDGRQVLWAGDAGEAMAKALAGLIEHGAASTDLPFADYPAYFEALTGQAVVRPGAGRHPRAAIWGALEARLMSADVMILAGLNEGTWPRPVETSPWLNRPMQADLGLEPPERRLSLAAHDFVAGAANPEVWLVSANKIDGAPAVPSRWLERLRAVLGGLGAREAVDRSAEMAGLASQIDRVDVPAPAEVPKPKPPPEARPRRLSVTQIERLIRDPYALYAAKVLDLEPLPPVDAPMSPADRGQIIHDILHRFTERCPGALGEDALERLIETGTEVFAAHMERPSVHAFWWPRFCRFAEWFIAEESVRRQGLSGQAVEINGRLELATGQEPFTLTARADRIDVGADGSLSVIDYKTGTVPSGKQVKSGLSPQLPLEAAIALEGGFEGIEASGIAALSYVRVSGGTVAGEWCNIVKGTEADALAREALQRLPELIGRYDDPDQAYFPRVAVQFERDVYDFDHLARYGEWFVVRDGGGRP